MIDFEYAIFDMDGTLVDSMKQWRQTGSIFLRRIGIEPTGEILKLIRTIPYEAMSQVLKERYGLHYTGVGLENEFFEIMRYSYKNLVDEKQGALAFLKMLKEMGIPMCVATGTCQELTQYTLKKLGMIDYFEFIITCPEVGKDKRSPLIFEKALERLGGQKENTIIFEDSLTAIKAAVQSGFRTIGVYDETSLKDKREIKKLAEQYVYNMSEVAVKEYAG